MKNCSCISRIFKGGAAARCILHEGCCSCLASRAAWLSLVVRASIAHNAVVEALVRRLLPVKPAPEQSGALARKDTRDPGVAVGRALRRISVLLWYLRSKSEKLTQTVIPTQRLTFKQLVAMSLNTCAWTASFSGVGGVFMRTSISVYATSTFCAVKPLRTVVKVSTPGAGPAVGVVSLATWHWRPTP